ncbi:MAG: hypothetical protein LBU87_04790 [Lactobacillales bacterium]|jgi:UTP-glucose-1-phosphate uridylyltransferase|nr:hypothetical protein [Lactobacillales bacterium]
MYDNIEFIVACGGNSTRNYPHSKNASHKGLLPLGDVRLIDITLGQIIKMGGRHITLVCSNQKVIDTFKEALRTDKATEEKLRKSGRGAIADVLAGTFLPEDTDLKFVIQDKPLGTAHVLGLAHRVSPDRAAVLLFPDDIILSHDENNSNLKKIVDEFLKDTHQVLLTGVEKEDVSNNAILVDGRLIEKPKNPTSNIGSYSPFVFPKETMDFIEKQTAEMEKTGIMPHGDANREWYYVDGINAFLDAEEGKGFSVQMFLKDDRDELLDTGTLPLYELAQIRALFEHSVFKEENKKYARELLEKNK